MALMKKKKLITALPTKLKKGDKVKVIAGKHKNFVGPIIKILPKTNRVILEGITMKKHQKPTQEDQQGGVIDIPAPIHISNVMVIDAKHTKEQKVSRLGYVFKDKKKTRIFKKSSSAAN